LLWEKKITEQKPSLSNILTRLFDGYEQHKVAKELVQHPDESYAWCDLKDGYKICVTENQYRGVHQRWTIVFSEQAYQREIKTLNKQLQAFQVKIEKDLWHLGNRVFQCEKDAQAALKIVTKNLKFHKVCTTIEPVLQHQSKGRPGKEMKPSIVGYRVKGILEEDDQKIALIKNTKGRFILATNQIDRRALPDTEILTEYKGQSKTESGFKFLKDGAFSVSSVFLKKPERIVALMMVMTLCLMVYAIAQYELRVALATAQDTIPNQLKKETAKPSMKWVYRLFYGVQVITLCLSDVNQEIVINLKAVQKKIIRYFGPRAMEIYGLT
jgi:transposase